MLKDRWDEEEEEEEEEEEQRKRREESELMSPDGLKHLEWRIKHSVCPQAKNCVFFIMRL